jgi:hypothetical protein
MDPALAIGLSHPQLSRFLEGRGYSVSSIEPKLTPDGHRGSRVTIALTRPAAPEEWIETEACAIYRESEDITGVVWLADLEEHRVAAFSPQWDGSVSCV